MSQSMLKSRVLRMKQDEKKDIDDSHASLFKVRDEFVFIFGGPTLEVLDLQRDICRTFELSDNLSIQAAFTFDQ